MLQFANRYLFQWYCMQEGRQSLRRSGRSPTPLPGERPSTVLLCGTYALELARPHPLIAQLPRIIHLPARATLGDPLRSVVDLLGAEVQRDGARLWPRRAGPAGSAHHLHAASVVRR